MSALWNAVLTASLYGGVVGLILLAIKQALFGKISAKWQLGLWMILILKLLIPIGPPSELSLFNWISQHPVTPIVSYTPPVSIPDDIITHENVTQTTPELAAEYPSPKSDTPTISVLPYVWLGGAMLTLCWFFLGSLFLRRKLRTSSHAADSRIIRIFHQCADELNLWRMPDIITQDIVKTPSLFGLLQPVILLGENINDMNDEHIRYILLHELLHYKRRDNILNILLVVLQSIHWFNPVLWFCFYKIREDMEQANDHATLHYINSTEHTYYADALLAVLRYVSWLSPPLVNAVGSKKVLTRRIQMIKLNGLLNRRKRVISALCIVLGASLCVVLLTGAMEKSTDDSLQSSVDLSGEESSSPEMSAPNDSNIDGKYLWPVTGYNRISAAYGSSWHPITKEMVFHNGIDIPAPEGTPVLTADKGTVVEIGDNETDGNYVILNHGGDIQTFYSQLFGFAEGLAEGDTVQQGDVIGYVGSTGESTGNHLHFELRVDGESVNPTSVFASED